MTRALALVGFLLALVLGSLASVATLGAPLPVYDIVATWGQQGPGDGEFSHPVDAFIDSTGRVLVADYVNDRVQVLAADGAFEAAWTGFHRPEKIAEDATGNFYVADTDHRQVVKLTAAGTELARWGFTDYPRGLCITPGGRLIVAIWGGRLSAFQLDGTPDTSWGVGGSVVLGGQLEAVRPDSAGNLYVVKDDTIVKLDPDGLVLHQWGGHAWPQDVFVDAQDRVFVADTRNHRVVQYDTDGVEQAVLGLGVLDTPHGVGVNADGRIYVADQQNHRIVVFDVVARRRTIDTDSTWRFSRAPGPDPGWTQPGYDDGAWVSAIEDSGGLCGPRSDGNEIVGPSIWGPNPVNRDRGFFRKFFVLDSIPTTATLLTQHDDDAAVYVNGTRVIDDRVRGTQIIYTASIRSHLLVGENVVAAAVTDTLGGCQAFRARVVLTEASEPAHPASVFFKQGIQPIGDANPEWESDPYAAGDVVSYGCGTTMAQCGCATTSLAMILRHHGVNFDADGNAVTPRVLNDYLRDERQSVDCGFASRGYHCGAVIWAAVVPFAAEAAATHPNQPHIEWRKAHAPDGDVLDGELSEGRPVAAKVGGIESHWVMISDKLGDTYVIGDPGAWGVTRTLLSESPYDNRYTTMRRYASVGEASEAASADTNAGGDYGSPHVVVQDDLDLRSLTFATRSSLHILVTDPMGRSAGFDPESGGTVLDVPAADYVLDENYVDTTGQQPPSAPGQGVRQLIIQRPMAGEYTVSVVGSSEETEGSIAAYAISYGGELEFATASVAIGTELRDQVRVTYGPSANPGTGLLGLSQVQVPPTPTATASPSPTAMPSPTPTTFAQPAACLINAAASPGIDPLVARQLRILADQVNEALDQASRYPPAQAQAIRDAQRRSLDLWAHSIVPLFASQGRIPMATAAELTTCLLEIRAAIP